MGLYQKIFSVNSSYQECKLTCTGESLKKIISAIFSYQQNTFSHALLGPKHKTFSVNFRYQEYLWTCIDGTLPQNLLGDLQRSRILMDIHWWDFYPKSFRWFSAIKNTYWHALVGPEHEIFSAICSYQEYLFTCTCGTWTRHLFGNLQLSRILIDCIGGTLTQILFGNFQLSKMHSDMHWWDFTIKSFRWISAIKKENWHALVRV